MITIADIANAANVSPTTVSNVLNGRTNRVSASTLERVSRITEELGYIPNMSARALASQSSKVVALVNYLHTITDSSFDDPFISHLTNAVEHTLRESGYYLMLRTISDANELCFFLQNWSVDGLFLAGVFEDDGLYPTLRNINKPIVLCDSYLENYGNMANIGLQDLEGAKLATQHLIKHGHKRIAFCSPPYRPVGVISMRLQGYMQALEEANIPYDNSLVITSGFSAANAGKAGRAIAQRNDVTAIFATSDWLAAGLMAGIRSNGKSIPDDYSIIGFDDLNVCQLTFPRLTTIRQNTRLKGQLAADMMVSMLENGTVEQNTTLPVYLVERDSVRPPKKF
ncbi:MAG: LacI family transcriptional regulator [Defluviitaleaceae bacterium]|nr:LacI family transcriptional regulator [Defluviitaleaceae bacterium]